MAAELAAMVVVAAEAVETAAPVGKAVVGAEAAVTAAAMAAAG